MRGERKPTQAPPACQTICKLGVIASVQVVPEVFGSRSERAGRADELGARTLQAAQGSLPRAEREQIGRAHV